METPGFYEHLVHLIAFENLGMLTLSFTPGEEAAVAPALQRERHGEALAQRLGREIPR